MSEENVERLRAYLEDWIRQPWTQEVGPDEQVNLGFYAPGVVYEDTVLPDHVDEEYRGYEGVLRAARRWFEPFEWLRIVEVERIVGGGDRLVSICRVRTKARHTGIEFELPVAWTWTFRGGRVIHFKSYRDPGEALEAAGLSE